MEITFKEGFEQTPRRPGPVAGFIEHGKESDSAEATFMARVELFNTWKANYPSKILNKANYFKITSVYVTSISKKSVF